mmetsp:Transcript_15049/g.35860  ORF Transcript_15049/g.35860 Transcript_15049/m.35860 type:complete len:232 (-) Transcript_15049:1075-1770(-)
MQNQDRLHARPCQPERGGHRGAPPRRHERGPLQLLPRQPRLPPGDARQPQAGDGKHQHALRRDARHKGPRDPDGVPQGREAGEARLWQRGHHHDGLRCRWGREPDRRQLQEARRGCPPRLAHPLRRWLHRARGPLRRPRIRDRAGQVRQQRDARGAKERQPAGRGRGPPHTHRQGRGGPPELGHPERDRRHCSLLRAEAAGHRLHPQGAWAERRGDPHHLQDREPGGHRQL